MNPRGSFLLVLVAACASPGQAPSQDARSLLDDGRIAQGEAAARAQLARAVSAHGEHSIEAAEALALLGETLRFGDEVGAPATLELCERAVALERELLPHDDRRLADALASLAMLRFARQEPSEVRPPLEEALAIRRRVLGENAPEVAMALIALANLEYDEHQELPPALAIFAQAKAIQDRALPPDHKDVGWRLMRQAVVLQGAAEFERSRADYERALEIFRSVLRPGHPRTATTLYNLGLVLKLQGEYAAARDRCSEALEMRIANHGPTYYLVAYNLLALAEIRTALGQTREARQDLERALAIAEQDFGTDSPVCLVFAIQLAYRLMGDDERERARALLERCQRVCAEHPDVGGQELPVVLEQLGALRQASGDSAAALPMLAEAQAAGERAFGPEDVRMAGILQLHADLLCDAGSAGSACELHERAARIVEQQIGSQSPELADALERLAGVRCKLGQLQPALEDALRAEGISRSHLAATASGFEAGALLDYSSSRSGALDLCVVLAAESGRSDDRSRALDAVVRSRGMLLELAVDRRHAIRASRDPRLLALAQELERASTRLANLLVQAASRPGAQGGTELEAARAKRDDLERRLAQASAGLRSDRGRSSAGAAEVERALPGQSALVSYFRSRGEPPTWFAFVTTGADVPPALCRLGAAVELDPLIESVVAAARQSAPEAEFRTLGNRLRERVWDPLQVRIGSAQRVFLVPDGTLAFVDFGSLPAAGPATDRRYLIETAQVLHQLTCERDLVVDAVPEPAGQGLLALGGPDFDADSAGPARSTESHSRGPLAGLRFRSLPGAAPEAEAIAALWLKGERPGKGELLEGREASESAFKLRAPGREYLHLATHAFSLACELPAGPVDSGRRGRPLPSPSPSPAAPLPRYETERPQLLAGLALAGVNQRGATGDEDDDGVLTSEEIACLDLTGTRWAVLSACDTGMGVAHSAEGVLGLRRAFLSAGVHTVISSLWPIDDALAHDWMVALYHARLERGLDTAQAMRAVALEMLQRRRQSGKSTEPASWAGFVATGDWR